MRPDIVCLCGSTKFGMAYAAAYRSESLAGKIVLSVGVMVHTGDEPIKSGPQKEMLDKLHLRKIDLADEILVLNLGGYIGESTRNEIAYAIWTKKEMRFLEPERGERYLNEHAHEIGQIIAKKSVGEYW